MLIPNDGDDERSGEWVLDALRFLGDEAARRKLHALAPILCQAFDDCLAAYLRDKTADLERQIRSHYNGQGPFVH